MPKKLTVVIVGAGIMGCVLFYQLSQQRGRRVLLLDRAGIANQTTGLSGGLVYPLPEQSAFATLTQRSLSFYQRALANTPYLIHSELSYSNKGQKTLIPALAVDTKKACFYLVEQALRINQLATFSCTEVIHLVTENNKVCGVAGMDFTIEAEQVVLATGASLSLAADYLGSKNFAIKGFQFNQYLIDWNDYSPMINHDLDFYCIPTHDKRVLAGFLNRDILVTQAGGLVSDVTLAKTIHQIVTQHYAELSQRDYQSIIAYDGFADFFTTIGPAHEVAGLSLALGASGSGIHLAPQALSLLNV